MDVFNIISLLGGLAMFLYGMRLMGDSLKEGSSGTLKKVMSKITNNPIKAFLLGLIVTAIIQSSTATIVITSGLVAAEIISLHQSLGIIIGANVGPRLPARLSVFWMSMPALRLSLRSFSLPHWRRSRLLPEWF